MAGCQAGTASHFNRAALQAAAASHRRVTACQQDALVEQWSVDAVEGQTGQYPYLYGSMVEQALQPARVNLVRNKRRPAAVVGQS
jgi:hypothetical protein